VATNVAKNITTKVSSTAICSATNVVNVATNDVTDVTDELNVGILKLKKLIDISKN